MSVPKTNFIQVNSEIQALKIIRKHLGRIYCPKCHKKHYIRGYYKADGLQVYNCK